MIKAQTVLVLLWLVPALLPSQIAEESALRQAVAVYWDSLRIRDKATALRYVHPDDINDFINRREAAIGGWSLQSLQSIEPGRIRVTVKLDQKLPNGIESRVSFSEDWLKTDQGWRVRVTTLEDLRSRQAESSKARARIPSSLDVFPKTLRFYALANKQPGVVVIRNGLELSIDVVSLEVDEEKFKVGEMPAEVAAGTVRRIPVRYIGDEKEPNLKSSATLKLRRNGDPVIFEIPILYNYADRVTQWLQQKAPAEMKRLEEKKPGRKKPKDEPPRSR